MGRVCGALLHGCSGTSATRIDLRSRRCRSVVLHRIGVYSLQWRPGESVWLRARCRQTIEHRRSAGHGPRIGPWPALAACLHALAVYLYLCSASWAIWAFCCADFLELAA